MRTSLSAQGCTAVCLQKVAWVRALGARSIRGTKAPRTNAAWPILWWTTSSWLQLGLKHEPAGALQPGVTLAAAAGAHARPLRLALNWLGSPEATPGAHAPQVGVIAAPLAPSAS